MHISYWSSIVFSKVKTTKKIITSSNLENQNRAAEPPRFFGLLLFPGGLRTLPHLSREFRCLPGLHALPGVNPEMGGKNE